MQYEITFLFQSQSSIIPFSFITTGIEIKSKFPVISYLVQNMLSSLKYSLKFVLIFVPWYAFYQFR